MAKIKQRGKAGAAKAYTTRTSAVRKLQISLADFRRLCILKGIFPREPRNRKKANKGSSQPTSFYYTKDIIYLQHEPVLKKLREHKAFAKKLARAVGRREWLDAKSLEENEPKYQLDHIIKERYPTFIDAVRDIDDALCLVTLFSFLPSNDRISPQLIENCARLSAEWQLYVMRTRALRKVFLSIKGVYFQAEVMGQTVTWLVPYLFTQHIPPDVDFRIMLTFLELYQTLLGFVLFKLYTDVNLVYPPPLDVDKDAGAAGVGAFSLQEAADALAIAAEPAIPSAKGVSVKDVRKAIQGIPAPDAPAPAAEPEEPAAAPMDEDADEPFVEQPSKSAPPPADSVTTPPAPEPTPSTTNTSLFAPYTLFLSREVTRPTLEFIIRSFGGPLGWAPTLGSGSPFTESDPSITHVIMDRPAIPENAVRKGRYYVQPQWVVDSVNRGVVLPEGKYAMGEVLPPHLSPFVDEGRVRDEGGWVPEEAGGQVDVVMAGAEEEFAEEAESDEEEEQGSDEEDEEKDVADQAAGAADAAPPKPKPSLAAQPALHAAASAPDDPTLLRAAELEAEAAGVPYAAFQSQLKAAAAKSKSSAKPKQRAVETEEEMAKIMMSSKKRKLYERMKYGERRREEERAGLERKKEKLVRGEKGGKRVRF